MVRKRKGKLRKERILLCLLGIFVVGAVFTMAAKDIFSMLEISYVDVLEEISKQTWKAKSKQQKNSKILSLDKDIYPKELIELFENNEETYDFVIAYPENKEKNFKINLSKEIKEKKIPLLLQWDKRWGYKIYGSNMIALTGCGPTCLSMVYIGLTKDVSMNPKEMAKFSEKEGYYTENGTSWSFMTEGAAKLGLTATELPLDENRMKQELLEENPIICSMGEGDFTTQGHFIVLTGVDKEGKILLNDPNSRKNSEMAWEYTRLERQIKNLWVYTIN